MEEEAPPRRSVAELSGRFKDPLPARGGPAGDEADKPVRRRPPRTLQLPKAHGDQQEAPPGATSPLPAKAKRNSALIEKLQANLALSPSGPPPKSPGFRLLPPAFGPPSPASPAPSASPLTPPSPTAASPLTDEEGPASFDAPPTAAEGDVLQSINKGRVRHSVRRRPPSRRHRKPSNDHEVDVTHDDTDAQQNSSGGGGGGGRGGGGGGGGEGGGGGGDPSTPHENKPEEEEEEETKKSVGVTDEGGGGAPPKQEEEETHKEEEGKTDDTSEEAPRPAR